MLKVLFFKSKLCVFSWIFLASFLSISLAQAMIEEKTEQGIPLNARTSPMDMHDTVGYINSFLPAERDQRAMSGVSKLFRKVVNDQAQESHILIKNKMQKLSEQNQSFIRKILGHVVDCNKHPHPGALRFINSFTEDMKNWNGRLYQQLLKHPNLSRSQIYTMRAYATEFDFFESAELVQSYAAFSVEQLEALKRNAEALFKNVERDYRSKCLKSLSAFSAEQLEVLGCNSKAIFKNVENFRRSEFLSSLSAFSAKQLEALGRNAEALFKNVGGSDQREGLKSLSAFSVEQLDALGRNAPLIFKKIKSYHQGELLSLFSSFSVEQLNVLGKYNQSLIPSMPSLYDYQKYFNVLKPFSVEMLEALGRNAKIVFRGVEDCDRHYYINQSLKRLIVELSGNTKKEKNWWLLAAQHDHTDIQLDLEDLANKQDNYEEVKSLLTKTEIMNDKEGSDYKGPKTSVKRQQDIKTTPQHNTRTQTHTTIKPTTKRIQEGKPSAINTANKKAVTTEKPEAKQKQEVKVPSTGTLNNRITTAAKPSVKQPQALQSSPTRNVNRKDSIITKPAAKHIQEEKPTSTNTTNKKTATTEKPEAKQKQEIYPLSNLS